MHMALNCSLMRHVRLLMYDIRTDHAQDLFFIQLNGTAFSHKLWCCICKASLLIDMLRLQ